MNTLLERLPETEESVGGNKYCHIVCMCSPKMGLCGAYKPVQCGLLFIENPFALRCPVCKNEICEDCLDLVDKVCMRCGK